MWSDWIILSSTERKYREAERLLTRPNYAILANAIHPDRMENCTPAELTTAARLSSRCGRCSLKIGGNDEPHH